MTQYQCVEIESGDTLWSIAKEYKPDNKDVRQVVYDICEANDMSADDLTVGQKIIIPVYQ
jgi:LysM repeat protein